MPIEQNRWLVKSDPGEYSWGDLFSDEPTVWDGVTNALALIHIRKIRQGDMVLVYHTGTEKAVVGVARAASDPYPDPKMKDSKIVVFDLKAVRALGKPVPLATIKSHPKLKDWELVRLGRLSVMPVTGGQWDAVMKLSGE